MRLGITTRLAALILMGVILVSPALLLPRRSCRTLHGDRLSDSAPRSGR